jgi:hypothetical protein
MLSSSLSISVLFRYLHQCLAYDCFSVHAPSPGIKRGDAQIESPSHRFFRRVFSVVTTGRRIIARYFIPICSFWLPFIALILFPLIASTERYIFSRHLHAPFVDRREFHLFLRPTTGSYAMILWSSWWPQSIPENRFDGRLDKRMRIRERKRRAQQRGRCGDGSWRLGILETLIIGPSHRSSIREIRQIKNCNQRYKSMLTYEIVLKINKISFITSDEIPNHSIP